MMRFTVFALSSVFLLPGISCAHADQLVRHSLHDRYSKPVSLSNSHPKEAMVDLETAFSLDDFEPSTVKNSSQKTTSLQHPKAKRVSQSKRTQHAASQKPTLVHHRTHQKIAKQRITTTKEKTTKEKKASLSFAHFSQKFKNFFHSKKKNNKHRKHNIARAPKAQVMAPPTIASVTVTEKNLPQQTALQSSAPHKTSVETHQASSHRTNGKANKKSGSSLSFGNVAKVFQHLFTPRKKEKQAATHKLSASAQTQKNHLKKSTVFKKLKLTQHTQHQKRANKTLPMKENASKQAPIKKAHHDKKTIFKLKRRAHQRRYYSRDEKQLLAAKKGHYTIQLLDTINPKKAEDFIANNKLTDDARIYEYTLNGKKHYEVVLNDFNSKSEALLAIAHLPIELQRWYPEVQTIAVIQTRLRA